MLDLEASNVKVSTGLDALDDVLGGLYWGDNVVWEVDGTIADPFYTAIADRSSAFDARIHISFGGTTTETSVPELIVLDAGPNGPFAQPADLLREIQRLCHTPSRRLLLFETLDSMVAAWGAHPTRGFFARCCPMLLEASAIAYWTMSAFHTPDAVRATVRAVTQCILRVDQRSVRVTKAEGRDEGVTGSVLHRRFDAGRTILEPANVNGRVAASLRALRRSRALSQHDLAGLAGVTPSAISQAERAERGLSLTTVVRLAGALGITIDDLLRGDDAELYRIGRRVEDPQHVSEQSMTLLGGEDSELHIDLVQLGPRESATPSSRQKGSGIVAVAAGMVAVEIGGQTPAVRHGEVLVADSERVDGWRNIGHGEATLFWIVLSSLTAARPHRSV